MSFKPPAGFWKSFAQDTWGKQPRVFKKLFGDQLLCPREELFRIVSEETARFARMAGARVRVPGKVFIDTGQLASDPLRYMPRRDDITFESWSRRVRQEADGRSVCFHMDGLQSHSPLLFERYRQFTDGMFEQLGLPPLKIDSDLFAGDYQETPIGVHKDVTGNFAFIAVGRKRMLLWPYESLLRYVDSDVDPRNIDFALQLKSFKEIRDQAIVLEGEPGDVFYWPGYFWHSAEGTGEVSVTHNMAVYLTGSPLSDAFMGPLMSQLGPTDEDQPFTPYAPARRQELAGAVPDGLRSITQRMVQGLKALVDGGLERELELTWLRYVSAGGFLQVPPPARDVVLDEARALRLTPEAGLVWRTLSSGELACAANGLVTCRPASRGMAEVLQRLSDGGAYRPKALLDEVVEERTGDTVLWSRAQLHELLTTLVAQRALVPA